MIVFTAVAWTLGCIQRQERCLRFDGAKAGVETGNGAAALLGFLCELGADALKGVADGRVGRGHMLIAMINFKAGGVCLCWAELVHSCLPLTILL